ncbi:MAG TPA: redox-regulated ATPase YchF [Planctomycetia bacterium]|nr:redox-regulated ATPase YchF [Planctomycetia bacterium]
MEAGIVGLPNVGKSTLFNALTQSKQAQSANFPFCTIEPNEGIVPVPDDRLERISRYIVPKKLVPSTLKLVDIAGIVKGASEGQGLGNKFLSHIREVDAILQVCRCFEDPEIIHVAGKVDPLSDIETVELELLLADEQMVDAALPKAERAAKSGDKDIVARVEVLKKCKEQLAKFEPLRKLAWEKDEKRIVASYGLLSAKPILYVANVSETDLAGAGPLVQSVREFAVKVGAGVVPVCAKLEAEIAELDEADRREMLAANGLAEPALAALAREAYRTLGMQSYFTAGEKEVRAWGAPVGATAPQAAGVIHTDFEKGFIRAEIYTLDDLEQYKSEKELRAAGKLRVEGKSYVMKDGDICHFLIS